MSDDLIERLRDQASHLELGMTTPLDTTAAAKHLIALSYEAADALAGKDTALSDMRADRDAIYKMLVIANAQLADMEFLSVEGFIGWKEDRAARALSQDDPADLGVGG